MNVFTASGNLGRDAETRTTPNDKQVTSFSIGVSSGWGQNKTTTWVRCVGWGDRYTKIAQYLIKGCKVVVSGELSLREYESNGEKRTSLDLNLRELDLPPKPQSAPQSQPQGGQDFDDDIPFSRAVDPSGW